MTAEQWTQVQHLFEAALDRDPSERDAFLNDACGNAAIRAEVASLLDADATPHPLLDSLALEAIALPDDLLPPGILPSSGDRVGPYQVIEPIGRGGMGAVFLAERADGQFQQRVALKLIRTGAASEALLSRFHAERQILAGLHHPNVARLLDGGVSSDGHPYFAMEHVDGLPIDAYVASRNSTTTERLRLFIDVCLAVQYAHRRLVVHRDIKPSNVLVTPDGRPMLLDFGIARVLDNSNETNAPSDLTRTGQAVMTPAYAAPEQVRHETVTTATDVYALGVLLYELLAERRPYDLDGCTPAEVERIVCKQVPPRPSSTAPPARSYDLTGDLDTIVMKALRKEPERRYASPEHLAGDLQRWTDGRPVHARPDTFRYRAGKFVQRHRAAVASVAAGLLLVASLITFYTVQLASERDRARVEAATASQVSQFLGDLFATAAPTASRGTEPTARDLLDDGAARIDHDLTGQPLVQSRLMQVMGEAYQDLGSFDEAASLLERALNLGREHLGPRHPDVASTMNSLAVLRQETGRYEAADSLYRQALALQQFRLGSQDTIVAATLHNWGTLLHAQGQYDRADSLYQQALDVRQALLAPGHPATASTLNEIATLHYDRGDLDAAADLYRETYELRQAHYGGDHPDVAASLNNLGMVLRHKGDFDASEDAYLSALAMRERVYDGPHPDVAHTLNHLGRLHANRGDYAAGEPYARRALDMRIDLFGEEHVEVTASMGNLAGILSGMGDPEAAAEYYRRALDINRSLFGDEHPYVAAFTYSLGSVLHAAGRQTEAETLYRESLALHRTVLPAEHPNLAYPLLRLGTLLVETGRAPDAEGLLREAVTVRTDALGPDHWRVAAAENLLGWCLARTGRPDEARDLLQRSTEILEATHGPDDARTRAAAQRLAEIDPPED